MLMPIFQVMTVYVNRGKTFRVTSDNYNVKFTGLRFEISDGSEFSLSLAAGEDVSTATFTGVMGQVSYSSTVDTRGERGYIRASVSDVLKTRSPLEFLTFLFPTLTPH